jgi:hypothetical protein
MKNIYMCPVCLELIKVHEDVVVGTGHCSPLYSILFDQIKLNGDIGSLYFINLFFLHCVSS